MGGLPDYVDFKEIIEPLRLLFKDEVRQLEPGAGAARVSGHAPALPRPGLAIRVIGDLTKEKLDTCGMPTPSTGRGDRKRGTGYLHQPVFRRAPPIPAAWALWATDAPTTILWRCAP